jgi:hypothetical protein
MMPSEETPLNRQYKDMVPKTAVERLIVPGSGASKSTQFKFRLSSGLNDKIEEAARRNGWGASEEIRRRLQVSFAEELRAGDDETHRLVEAIRTTAQNLEVPFGSWHENRFAFDVFVEAAKVLMALYRPPGESVRPSDNEIADLYLGTTGTPETAGRMLAGGAAAAANIPMPGTLKRQEPAQAERKR